MTFRRLSRVVAPVLALAVLVGGPTSVALAANAGQQQYVDPFAQPGAGSRPKPAQPTRKPAKPTPKPAPQRSGSTGTGGPVPAPSGGSGGSGTTGGSSGSSAGTRPPAAGAGTVASGGSPSLGGSRQPAAGRRRGAGAPVRILPAGDAVLLGVAERVPVVGNALRTGEHA